MRTRLGLPAALLSLACAHVPRQSGNCALPGGEAWREYRSAHFIIDVAGWSGDPSQLVGAFEQLHAAVLASLVAEPVEIAGHVRVIAVPTRRDLQDATGISNLVGMFTVTSLGEPIILMSAEDVGDIPEVVAHELTHYISSYLFPQQPFWFAEGLAQFVESVAKVDRDGKRWAGRESSMRGVTAEVQLTPVENLFAPRAAHLFDDPYYTALILYRLLWNEHGSELTKYERLLGEGVSPDVAWEAAFPQWSVKKGKLRMLDNEIARHRNAGRGLRWEISLPKIDVAAVSAKASLADIHMALLERAPKGPRREALQREALAEALRHEPDHPAAMSQLAKLQNKTALEGLKLASAARPTDGRVFYLLAREEKDAAAREAHLRRAIELWPDSALANAALAIELASTGRAREAVAFANRGVDLAPWNADAVAALGRVALELGKCREALILQTRAVDAVKAHSLGAMFTDADGLRKQLATVQTRCAQPAAAGGG